MLPAIDLNFWAILVSAIVSMVIGGLWYSPILFGNIWMNLMKFNPKDMEKMKEKGMGKYYLTAFIGSLVTSFVLAIIVDYAGAVTVSDALMLGFLIWLGFIVTVALGSVLWEGKPIKVFLINVAHQLVHILIMSIILTLWI